MVLLSCGTILLAAPLPALAFEKQLSSSMHLR
jgi:hypothetical protein